MATGRDYAKSLVGDLDRSSYNTQRDVANQTSQTNWENIQNQYKNLTAKLKKQQEDANRQYAEGLASVASNSYDRSRASINNLVNNGVGASGLTDLVRQADTQQKGEDIANLLKSSNSVATDTADKLASANTQATEDINNLASKIASTLSTIGDNETSAQNSYNQALANIGETMEAREESNKLAAMERALTAASAANSKEESDLEKQLDSYYKGAAINEILASDDMTDEEKVNYLKTNLEVANAQELLDNYTSTNEISSVKSELEDAIKTATQNRLNTEDAKRSGSILKSNLFNVLYNMNKTNKSDRKVKELEKEYSNLKNKTKRSAYDIIYNK